MSQDILHYEDHFAPGMRIQVEIPLSRGRFFRDDAEILSLQQDLLQLSLSRTVLPEAAILEVGAPLFIRLGDKGAGVRCRGILLTDQRPTSLVIRLTGETLPLNDREFFRIDVFIPLTYRAFAGEPDLLTLLTPQKPLPVAANLSGAGVRIHIPEPFPIDQQLELTLFLPPDFGGALTLQGQVVYSTRLGTPDDGGPLFDTALRFVSVAEHHRDNLLKFIHAMQLEQLQMLREQSLESTPPKPPPAGWADLPLRHKVMQLLGGAVALLLAIWLISALARHYSSDSKGILERTFEDQIRKFRGQ